MSVPALRQIIGIGGAAPSPIREAVSRSGVGWYPAVSIGLLGMVDQFHGHAFVVLAPELSRSLGIPRSALAGMLLLSALAFTLAGLPMAAFVGRFGRRGLVSVLTGIGWSATTMGTAFVGGGLGLAGITVADGATSGSVRAVHPPLLADSYPVELRVRMQALYRAMDGVGNVVAPLLVAALTALAGLSWRGVFLALGGASLVSAVVAVRLRDPGYGRWDTARVRAAVRGAQRSGAERAVELGLVEVTRRLFLIPTYRRILAGSAALGVLLAPLVTYVFFFLDERWGMGPGARGVFFAVIAAATTGGMAVAGPLGERWFRRDPSSLLRGAAGMLAAGLLALSASVLAPAFWMMAVLYAVFSMLLAAMGPFLTASVLSLTPARMRPHATALEGVFLVGVGGMAGLLLLSGIDRRFGTTGAILSIAVPGLLAALVLRSAAATMNADIDRMLERLEEEERTDAAREEGRRFPLLTCERLDVAYGPVQVLFDVNLTVEEGEVLAIVGTNGAGKSTLLATLAGTMLPADGTVRFDGADITYLDAKRRVGLGITTVRAGEAVVDPLSVAENLRLFARSLRPGRAAAAVDDAFAAFPILAERRDHRAATLSGGERQMLGLARAVIASPRLLLVDELTLGLSPGAVDDLLAVVSRLHRAGTTVVMVEQSVDLALRIAPRACFLERGRVLYDGPAPALRDHPLVRAAFLGPRPE